MCVCESSGHAGPVRRAVHPDCSGVQKTNAAHRQQHPSHVERRVQVHTGSETGQRAAGQEGDI